MSHNKGDWYLIIQDERTKYKIDESDDEILKMSQNQFRKINQYALKYLNTMASKHSNLQKMQMKSLKRRPILVTIDFSIDFPTIICLKNKNYGL